MTRAPAFAALVLLAATCHAPTARAAIPAFNGTCPGGVEVHADDGGPVYIDGREAKLKRFSDDYYEARDSNRGTTLSITRSPDGGLQMSYTGQSGRNGVCTVGVMPRDRATDDSLGQSNDADGRGGGDVTCESRGQGRSECDMDTHGDVRLVRQLSKSDCVKNQSWGLYHHSVWVQDGCRAVFRSDSGGSDHANASRPSYGGGSYLLRACNQRASDQGSLVTSIPVNDDVTELIVDYGESRYLCMVNNTGSVLSLTRIKKR